MRFRALAPTLWVMDTRGKTIDPARRWMLRLLVLAGAGLLMVGLAACLPPGAQANATSVAAGKDHACAVLADGTVTCWGTNTSGQAGTGTLDPVPSPAVVAGLTGVVSVTGGDAHTCALDGDATVWCWGEGSDGQLGTGGSADALTPVAVLSDAVSVTAGAFHTCAALDTGAVRCWGRNTSGQLGDGTTTSTSSPVAATGLAGIGSVSAGASHSCALAGDGTVSCWGLNSSGQVGDGTTTGPRLTPTVVAGLAGVTQIDAGGSSSCARLADGTARCWGANSSGQLGNGSFAVGPTPTTVSLPAGVDRIDVGSAHACAVVAGGQAWCWGSHSSAQTGDGTQGNALFDTQARPTPARVVNPDPSQPISLRTDLSVEADPGALFDDATAIAAGGEFTCAAKTNRTIQCWGRGAELQLGDGWMGRCSLPGSQTDCWIPVHVGVSAPFTGSSAPAAATSNGHHTCAVEADNTAVCWGANGSGRQGVGHGAASTRALSSRVANVASVGAGDAHSCWALTDGTVRCAGSGGSATDRSALGYSTNATAERVPLTVTGGPKTDPPAITTAVQVVAGRQFSCARLADGTVECWGSNSLGQLGTSLVTGTSVQPVQACLSASVTCLEPLSGIVELAAGRDHVCALRDDGTVWCWGNSNAGQAGLPSSSPTQITGISGATTIGLGDEHSCAALAAGGVKCWGRNSSGQLGAIFPASGPTPVTVSGLTGVVDQLDGGSMHTCAVSAGDLWCWGENHQGQLGTGATAGTIGANDCPVAGSPPQSQGSCVPDPVQVSLAVDAAAVVAGASHTCVRSTAGGYQCWGANDANQTGSATVGTPMLSPVAPVTPPGG